MLIAAAALAPAAHATPRDSVHGSAQNMFVEVSPYPANLSVHAKGMDSDLPTLEGLLGTGTAKGHVTGSGALPNGEFVTKGEVTCLRVVGNRATIKYRFTSTEGAGAPSEGWGVQVFIEDNGHPSGGIPDGNATDAPMRPELFEPQAHTCEFPRGPYNPVDSGNYVVRDGD